MEQRNKADMKRAALISAGTELIRRRGYTATTVDQICAEAEVTKGAFFHHFESKEALVSACLDSWNEQARAMDAGAPYHSATDPPTRVSGYMSFYIDLFSNPALLKSCLAGTTAQDVYLTHPKLRRGAQDCLATASNRFEALLDDAAASRDKQLNTASLARLWMATLQGSLVLSKASQDDTVIGEALEHVKALIESALGIDANP